MLACNVYAMQCSPEAHPRQYGRVFPCAQAHVLGTVAELARMRLWIYVYAILYEYRHEYMHFYRYALCVYKCICMYTYDCLSMYRCICVCANTYRIITYLVLTCFSHRIRCVGSKRPKMDLSAMKNILTHDYNTHIIECILISYVLA